MNRRTLASLIVSAALPLVSGCGGSSSSKPLTRSELIAKADPICRTVVRTVDYYKLTPAIIVRFAARLAGVEERAYRSLSKLTPPPSLLGDWQFVVDGFRDSARDFRSLEGATHPEREGGRLESLYGAVRGKAWTAREDGFKDCGHY